MFLRFAFVFYLFFSLSAQAESLLTFSATRAETSDDLNSTLFGLRFQSHRFDPIWPYPELVSKAWAFSASGFEWNRSGAGLRSVKVGGSYFLNLEERWFKVDGGVTQVQNSQRSLRAAYGSFGVEAGLKTKESFVLVLSLTHDFHAPTLVPLTEDLGLTRGVQVGTRATWRPSPGLKVQLKPDLIFLDQGERRTFFDGEVMWRVAGEPNWIWLGVGSEWLGYSGTVRGLWSPANFQAHGARLDSALPIGEGLGFFLGGSASFIREDQRDWGTGHYVRSGFRFGQRTHSQGQLFVESNQSIQGGRFWKSQGLGLQWDYSF